LKRFQFNSFEPKKFEPKKFEFNKFQLKTFEPKKLVISDNGKLHANEEECSETDNED